MPRKDVNLMETATPPHAEEAQSQSNEGAAALNVEEFPFFLQPDYLPFEDDAASTSMIDESVEQVEHFRRLFEWCQVDRLYVLDPSISQPLPSVIPDS